MSHTDLSRLSRLTAILTLLQSKRLITAGFIAEKFNVSIRTVYRDMQALVQAGVPVYAEDGKGYKLMEGYRIPPVMFTEMEANALITAEKLVLKNKDSSFINSYIDAITKIKAVLKYNTKENSDLLSERIHIRLNTAKEITSDSLSSIQLAITHHHPIKIEYHAIENNNITIRVIEPLALYSTQENWILIAFCRLRKDNRSFRLDRIHTLEILEETFKPIAFNLENYFEQYKKSQNP